MPSGKAKARPVTANTAFLPCALCHHVILSAAPCGSGYAVLAFRHIRAQAYIGLCKLNEAMADFTAVIDGTDTTPSKLADQANQETTVQYVEALLDRGGLRHFLGQDGVQEDWSKAEKAMPSVDVAQHVSALLGEWVQLESWQVLPKARKLVALSSAGELVEKGQLEEALAHYDAAVAEPDTASSGEQQVFDASQLHQSRGALRHVLGRSYSEDAEAVAKLGVENAEGAIAKLAVQMAQQFPAVREAASPIVQAGVLKDEGNKKGECRDLLRYIHSRPLSDTDFLLAVNAKEYVEAIERYTDAIALDPNNHTLFSNRSMCAPRCCRRSWLSNPVATGVTSGCRVGPNPKPTPGRPSR